MTQVLYVLETRDPSTGVWGPTQQVFFKGSDAYRYQEIAGSYRFETRIVKYVPEIP